LAAQDKTIASVRKEFAKIAIEKGVADTKRANDLKEAAKLKKF